MDYRIQPLSSGFIVSEESIQNGISKTAAFTSLDEVFAHIHRLVDEAADKVRREEVRHGR